jgi:hypothetical protein
MAARPHCHHHVTGLVDQLATEPDRSSVRLVRRPPRLEDGGAAD